MIARPHPSRYDVLKRMSCAIPSPDQPPSGRGFVMERAGIVVDSATVDEIDRAIRYALERDELDPRIRDAFIDALLDKRLQAVS